MKEICKLAHEKGFKAKALSTDWTLKDYNGKNSGFKINDTCDYLLLCEIQKWIREEFNLIIFVFNRARNEWDFALSEDNIQGASTKDYAFLIYEEALKFAVKETLKTI